jgi:hypothetical protein
VKIEVVKGNSMRNVDNFTGVMNKLAGSEAMPMISARLLYMYIVLSGSYFSFL